MTTPDKATLPKIHSLKCWPDPFGAMERGEKTAEFRLNDRDFREGDVLVLREWCPVSGHYTGAELRRTITHVLDAGFGLPDGYAMLSLNRVDGDTDFMCPFWSGAYWRGYEAHRAGRAAAQAEADARVKALEAENAKLREASGYWHYADHEYGYGDLADLLDDADTRDVHMVDPWHQLPTLYAAWSEENGWQAFPTEAEARRHLQENTNG